ncbi:MAG TPA: hypothetical protein VGG97_06770 [Bryobacteraceae bacterium]|jgi:tetratricopeptide (TPR) repeat protein
MRQAVLLAVILLALLVHPAYAQHGHEAAPSHQQDTDAPIPLFQTALGTFARPISSLNTETQAYFNQGFRLMYAFDKKDARRSFIEAEKRDPDCAICYWGEAWSLGSFLNGSMQAAESPRAFAAIQKARKTTRASAVERAMIDAMSVRYVEHFDPSKQREHDIAYAEEMRKVHERFPKDLDVATLYGEALFLLEPRRGYRDIHSPNVQKILAVFESVLKVDSQHIGTCHLYIHLTEATTEPGRAEACANTIGNAIPGASHINHMPSHTWNQLGRWGDSVRANIQAWHSDQQAAVGEAFAIYPSHNLQMLLFAASMDGQGAIAIQAAKDYAKLTGSSMYRILTLIRFGRFNEVLEFTQRPNQNSEAAVWDFGQGYAKLRTGQQAPVREHLHRLLDAADQSSGMFRFNSAHNVLGVLGGILEGEVQRSNANLDQAIASFTRAVTFEDAMIYDEPEALPFSARHWLGAALLEAKRYSEAENVYREELKKHPHNGWSLFGLKASLDAQHKPSQDVSQDLDASWARSDTWLHGSAF